jgi:N-acetylated-alpha-linked acidic dipeptidase
MTKTTITIATAGLLCAAPLRAQQMTGYSPAAAERERRVEQSVVERPSPASASAHSRALTREPHMAGTAAQARTRDYVLEQMRRWGLATEVREYRVYLPHTREVAVWRVAPDTLSLSLAEGPVPGDTTIDAASEPVIANGWSGNGDASGPVVYVNYGLIEDYRLLDSLGVSVRGAVVVARYGRSFRGIKAREAERHGAAALLLYSDPADDGYTRGDVYPEGPMRPPSGLQRGAVANTQGDPTTPGYASRPGVPRADPAQDPDIPRIPVVPISYGNAAELLRGVRGQHIPQAWQGGLPFRYHIGPGPVLARVLVRSDTGEAAFKQIWNTLGIVRGSERPDEVVVVGAHRDAWAYGAVDNVSGTVSVLEAARAVAEEVRAGRRPRRTIIFATWDAEEWGLVGSTEYVEDDSLRLMRGGVAYLNQDAAASGARFGAGGSPSLRSLLRDVLRSVPDPAGGSVYERWRRSSAVPEGSEPEMDDPGGGSDFAGFYNHLGIPHLDWGFGGPSGVYHSFYDSYHWMSTFGDTGFVYHATAGRIAAATALRLANAEVLPYDYAEFARTLRAQLPKLAPTLDGAGDASSLGAALDRMERAATALAAARDSALSSGRSSAATRDRANAALLRVERALTRPEGLHGRPWYRSLIFAADENNGYATVLFPSVTEAARRKDAALVTHELADLATRFDAASAALAEATAALRAAR